MNGTETDDRGDWEPVARRLEDSTVAIGAEDNHPRRRVSVLDTEISFVDAGEGVPIVSTHSLKW